MNKAAAVASETQAIKNYLWKVGRGTIPVSQPTNNDAFYLARLCNQPTLTASSEKYAQLLHGSMSQPHPGVQSILSALDERATGFTLCANFESALQDAKLMRQISPSSALGYIREASIYSEQGKQRHVIDICNHGLSMVDTMDTHYDTLQRAKMDAEQHQNTRVDFISQLPVEIVITTLIPILFNDATTHTERFNTFCSVSIVWRDRIIASVEAVCFGSEHGEPINTSRICQFAPYVKQLEFDSHTHGTWLFDLLHNNKFDSLRELRIDGKVY